MDGFLWGEPVVQPLVRDELVLASLYVDDRVDSPRLLQAGGTVIITARNAPEKENNKLHFIPADLSKAEGTKVADEPRRNKGVVVPVFLRDTGALS
ncbi:hypothetical protein EGI32_21005 [Ferruginibacter sp. HRS2-29]|nr:hypothetical protein [Ferruginibacter sp. HRS2-29]